MKDLPKEVEEALAFLKETDLTIEIPILPLRNTVLFPMSQVPLTVGRKRSIEALQSAEGSNNLIGIVAQKESGVDKPTLDDLYKTGTVARIIKVLQYPDNNYQVIIQGIIRFEIEEIVSMDPYIKARVKYIDEEDEEAEANDMQIKAMVETIKNLSIKTIELNPQLPNEAKVVIENINDSDFLIGMVVNNLPLSLEDKQNILEIEETYQRLEKVLEHVTYNLQLLEISGNIQSKVKNAMDKTQKEFFLREQLKAIKKELGEDSSEDDADQLLSDIEDLDCPENVKEVALKELSRLNKMTIHSPEYSMIRTYLDWIISLPWGNHSRDRLNLDKAEKILNEDHYDLEKVKKRILEYLAVLKLKKDIKGPILCLVGPPGVGKTSLGKSVARALGRKFVRMSLGGVRDEAEIRGHRRTYIGALPGRIIQSIQKAGTSNPVMMLDEIDKLGSDFRGDPSSALLEVLDPEQNHSFSDHYLEVPYDLSKVLFLATANRIDTIPPALYDRMEIIDIPGYTQDDKLQIAKKFLIPKQISFHGLKNRYIEINDDAINCIISSYTREAGVRSLEREIAAVCRAVATKVAKGSKKKHKISEKDVKEILGPEYYFSDLIERTSVPGVVTGLAWTPVGGDILFIEATKMKGKSNLILTGHLGDVMKESAQAALSFIKSNAELLGINYEVFEKNDIHLHVPAGAIPKDGPSAGITIFTAITSLLLDKPVKEKMAMTGEITLRGLVLPIGGVREKVLAAKRAGVKKIILPEKNRRDLEEIPDYQIENLSFIFVKDIFDVVDSALGIKIKKKRKKK